MRNDVAPYPSKDIKREVDVLMWPAAATFETVINGTATGSTDLSPFVSSVSHSDREGSIKLSGTLPFTCSTQPKPGRLISINAEGQRLVNAAIDTLSEFREERGVRHMNITLRSRDAFGLWRDNRFTTQVYPAGTEFAAIAKDIASALGLKPVEYRLPATGFVTPHTNSQMSDMSPWEMLETLHMAAGLSPFFDPLGKLKTYRRDTRRPADLTLGKDRVIAITGSKARPPITNVKVKWLSRHLSKVVQQDQFITGDTVTAGFFKLEQKREQWFSDDRTQRAEATYMKVIQSVNSGLLPVGDEEYVQISTRNGLLIVTTSAWVPALATASIVLMLIATAIPDGVTVGATIPAGRLVHGIAEAIILLVMMSLGTGQYEFWGQPFDYVHAKNTTEAFDKNAPQWMDIEQVIDNDFIYNESHAKAVAIRELLYESAGAISWGATIVDDPRVEIGDIIALPDLSRLYITSWERNLTRGEEATLDLRGFRV
ncbi:MAG: hypothetical protein ACREK4_00115 [Candidatus Rokuibacteriota bacterium]